MVNALRLTIGNGQSFENVNILTLSELQRGGMTKIFGTATFGFQLLGPVGRNAQYKFVHAENVKVIHFHRERVSMEGAIPYERIVLGNDAVYTGGHILLEEHLAEFGVDGILLPEGENKIILFTARPEGLMMIRSQFITTLECRALVEDMKQVELRQFSAQRLPR